LAEFALSQHAYEESLRILQGLPEKIQDYAMALDDFGELYVATVQFEAADKMQTKPRIYQKVGDHGGMARSSGDLQGLRSASRRSAAAANTWSAR
jgi:hypothetical protein